MNLSDRIQARIRRQIYLVSRGKITRKPRRNPGRARRSPAGGQRDRIAGYQRDLERQHADVDDMVSRIGRRWR